MEPNVTPGTAFTSFPVLCITFEAALYSGITVRNQSNEGVKLMCRELAFLHPHPNALVDNDTNEEIFDHRPDTYYNDDTFAQKTGVLVDVLIQECVYAYIESYGLVLVPVAGSTSWRRVGW